MEEEEDSLLIPKPAEYWVTKLISLQADIIYNCLVTLLSPILSIFSLLSESYHRAEKATDTVESVVHAAAKVPSSFTHGSILLLRKIVLGFIGAAYVCMVMMVVMVLAAVVGVGLVQLWVEEPVCVRESLYFDYTDFHPKAVFSFGGGGFDQGKKKNKKMGVPVGHTVFVSLVLLMPESDFNREIGVFQFTAELLSSDHGDVIAKSSLPCMLRFRSLPVRLTRTFLMSIPLLLGISGETQTITIDILKHKEVNNPRTQAIRVILSPRAGTLSLPQLYKAEIIINSQLPWTKELVRNWKWTFYVWTSLYIYIFMLIILLCCCKPLVFPMTTTVSFSDYTDQRDSTVDASEEPEATGREDNREISETLRKWQRNRSKRKAMFLHRVLPETAGSSAASSISVTRESLVAEEDVGDSESVCA